PTRREFLTTAAAGLAAARTVLLAAGTPDERAPALAGDISVRVTAGDNRYAAVPALSWRRAAETGPPEAIVLEPGKALQPILGFGAAFTDAACHVLSEMPNEDREALLRELFHPEEMGFSVCRTCIGSSDYARSVYSYDEGEPDPTLTRFSIDHDR